MATVLVGLLVVAAATLWLAMRFSSAPEGALVAAKAARSGLAVVGRAVEAYALREGALPCPESANCAAGAGDVVIGLVPADLLGLERNVDDRDPWGRPLLFAVTRDLTEAGAWQAGAGGGELTLLQGEGGSVPSAGWAWVLVSGGADGVVDDQNAGGGADGDVAVFRDDAHDGAGAFDDVLLGGRGPQ